MGFHVYKKRTKKLAKVGDEVEIIIEENKISKEVDHCCCAFKRQNPYFKVLKAMGNVPREISYLFLPTEVGKVYGKVSNQYRPSAIFAGGQEIPKWLKRFAKA